MVIKNTTKLIYANISTFLKGLAYKIVIALLIFCLCLPFGGLLLTCFGEIFSEASNSVGLIIGGWNSLAVSLNVFFGGLINAVFRLFEQSPAIGIYILFVLFFVFPFLLNATRLIILENLYGYMSSLSKFGFLWSFLKRFGKAASYALYRTLISLPINSLIFLGLAGILYHVGFIVGLMPIFIVIYLSVLVSVKNMIFAGIGPTVVVFNQGIHKSFMKGERIALKNFYKTLMSFFFVCLFFAGLAVLFSVYSLIIVIPLCTFSVCVLEMTTFFEAQGMRYYINMEEIVTPKRLEESDNLKKAKFIV